MAIHITRTDGQTVDIQKYQADSYTTDVDGNRALRTTASITGDVNVDANSVSTSGLIGKASGTNADFTTAYASGTTITLSSLPTGTSSIKADDIISISQVAVSGAVTNTYTRDDVTITTSGTDPTTVTVSGATFVATDTFIVYTNNERIQDKINIDQLNGNTINTNGGNIDTGTQTVAIADDDNVSTKLTSIEGKDFATSAKQLADNHNVTVSNMIPAVETGLATSAKQLADDHNVTVSNMIPAVETGLATSTNQTNATQKSQVSNGTIEANVIVAADDDTNLDGEEGLVTNSVLNARIDADKIKPLRMDGSTHSMQTIEYEHHEIHAGSSFVVSDVQSVSTTTMKWQITTPASTKYSHMIFGIECTGECLATITEGSDRTDGTALTEINRNRVGTPTVAGTIVTRTPTGGNTDGAITLQSLRIGATGVGSKTISAGGARGQNEFVLKPGTKYIVSAQTFAAVFVTFTADWYEHTDKD